MKIHSKAQGTVGELLVASQLIQQGYSVFKEIGDLARVDLIVLDGIKCIKIQVKSLQPKRGCLPFGLRKSGPGYEYVYTPNDVDVFAVHNAESNQIAFVTWSDLGQREFMNLRLQPSQNNQTKGIQYFSDYLDFSRVRNLICADSRVTHTVACKATNEGLIPSRCSKDDNY